MKKTAQFAALLLTAAIATPSLMAQRPLGTDVSAGSGTINWSSVYSDGVRFAFAHATTGISSKDSQYANNMIHGKSAGVQMGAYHVAEAANDTPSQEAAYFWNNAGSEIKADGKTISPAIDFEVFQGHDGATSYTAWVNAWSADVIADGHAAHVTFHPILYTSACGFCNFTTNLTLGHWVADYNGENLYTGTPSNCKSCWNTWDFWQVSSTGAISGISGPCDLDTYNGTLTQMISKEGVTSY